MESIEELINLRDAVDSLTSLGEVLIGFVGSSVYFLFDDTRCIFSMHEEITDSTIYQYETHQ